MVWQIEVEHGQLKKYRMIRGSDQHVVRQRAASLQAQWDDEWARKSEILSRKNTSWNRKGEAAERTEAANRVVAEMQNLLRDYTASKGGVDWEHLKDRSAFSRAKPIQPFDRAVPEAPSKSDSKYKPNIGFAEIILPHLKQRELTRVTKLFESDDEFWAEKVRQTQNLNAKANENYEVAKAKWVAESVEFQNRQRAQNDAIDVRAAMWNSGDESTLLELFNIAISQVKFPNWLNINFEIDYNSTIRSCVLEFELPNPSEIPTLKEVRYVQAREEFSEKHLSESETSKLYDDLIYQICLCSIFALFSTSKGIHLDRVTFNGWVDYVNLATGLDERSCIMTVGANKSDFECIDFSRVDPKECFKSLKGVSASKLIGLAPVAPLERPRLADKRFIESHEVASTLNDGVNIAAMDWQEFEHLVRQVFENEFASPGSEVKVTQASRDGGVDAIVLDPDPIRGGKIVIQAKRYTNTVDVSAVRDLFGTVHNEGALKGILVTTSQFGPDARKFAQGKPLTLIDGSNLLFLLEKMGVKARINLKEAKLLLSESSRTQG